MLIIIQKTPSMNVQDLLKQSIKEKQMFRHFADTFSSFFEEWSNKAGNVVNDSFYVFLLNLKVGF